MNPNVATHRLRPLWSSVLCRPVKTLRFCMMIFYQVFYVAVLNYLLAPLNCNWLSKDPSLQNFNVDFPQQSCLEMPYVAQLTASAIFAVLHIMIGGLFALADVSPNPVSQRYVATAHSEVEVKAWGFKTLIVLCINLLSGYWKLQAVPIMIFAFWMAYTYVRWVSCPVADTHWLFRFRF